MQAKDSNVAEFTPCIATSKGVLNNNKIVRLSLAKSGTISIDTVLQFESFCSVQLADESVQPHKSLRSRTQLHRLE